MRINRLNKIPVLLAGLIVFLLVFSCIHEEWNGVTSSVNEEAMVTVVIQSPGAGSASTRAITDTDEEDVKEIDVLVFEQTADGGEYVTTVSCSDTDITTDPNDSRRKTFTVKLTQGDFDLVILANAHDIVSATDWTGYTKSQVLEALEAAVPATGQWPTNPFTPFPMWGDVGEITIDDNTNLTGENRIKITRMVARVDVKLSGDALLNFHLTSVDVYNYNTRGTLVPTSGVWDAVNFKATGTTVPVSSTVVEGPLEYTAITSDAYCVQEIYLLEAANYKDAARTTPKGLLERTCLVVGGIWDAEGTNNFSGAPTYYRVDFCPTGTDLTQGFYDILRNHQYVFTITKVTGKGYDDSETAYKSAPVNIETEIVQWDEADMDDIWLDGQYYYSITPQESELWASASTGNEIYVKTDYPTWTFELSDLPTPGDPAADPSTLTWLTITSHTPGTIETGNGLRHTIRYDVERNTTGTSRVAYLHYSAGRFSTTVTITQYEWEIEDIYVTPTGDIPPPGEVRTVTIEGVFDDIDVRVRDILDNVVLDTNTVPGSQTSSTAVLTIPSLWKEGSRILAFEFYDMQLADWSAFHTDRQQGYYVDIYTSHTDGNAIANQSEDFTIYVSGLWPDVYVRAVLDGSATPLAGPVTIPAGSGSDNSQIISISANPSWTSRTIEFQKSMDGVNWEFMSQGIQSGYDVTVTTSHVANAAIINTGQTFSITVAGASGSLYPAIDVRAVVQGSETLAATTVTVPGGSGTNTAYTIAVNPNASWSSRAVELQWNRNGVWTAISSGQQGGYNADITVAGFTDGDEINGKGETFTIVVSGYYPQLWFRGYDKNGATVVSTTIPTLPADATNTVQQVSVTIEGNSASTNRTVTFQWDVSQSFTDPQDITYGIQPPGYIYTSEGRILAEADAMKTGPTTGNAANMTWAEAMGINTVYDSNDTNVMFYNSGYSTGAMDNFGYQHGTAVSADTGCGAYWEGSQTDPVTGKGKWFLPTVGEVASIWEHLPFMDPTSLLIGYWTSTEDVDTGTSNRAFAILCVRGNTFASQSKTNTARESHVRCVRNP